MNTIPNDDIPSQIIPMILYKFKDDLETAMVHNVPDDNPTRAILVKVGRFQDNPVSKNVSLAISPGDFEDPAFIDGRIDHEDLDAIRIYALPVGEVGGGQYWWRRGTINLQCFFVRQLYDEERAMLYAYDFYGRLLKSIEQITFNFADDYGELASGAPYLESATFFESGGNNRYIWRGKLRWRVLTFRP